MSETLERYIDRILAIADLRSAQREAAVREELRDHLTEKAEELEAGGYCATEAILKALEDHGNAVTIGYKLRPWRLLDVRLRGTARGVIAIGPRAHGCVALGGMAVGLVAIGGCSIGLISIGGFALSLLFAWGGFAAGLLAYGGFALGVVACGGFACGAVAAGGAATGLFVPGAGQVIKTVYTLESAPHWLSWLATFMHLDPEHLSKTLRQTGPLTMAMMVWLFAGIGAQAILTNREARRVRQIDPHLLA